MPLNVCLQLQLYSRFCYFTLLIKIKEMQNYLFKTPLILLILSIFLSACDKEEEENPDLVTIAYSLSSQESGKLADIEYTSLFGVVIQLKDEPLPWSTSLNASMKIGDAISFKAESGDEGEMTAQIILNDEVVTSETAKYLIQLTYIKGLK